MAELHPNLEQKELEAPEEQDLLEAGENHLQSRGQQSEVDRMDELAQSAREAVDRHVWTTEEVKLSRPEQDADKTDFQLTRELKDTKYEQVLIQTQSRLQGPAKAFSKVIHKPVIERVSTAAADTIARPSGLLGGSVGALVGSLIVLLSAKHYGFAYNFLLFLFLFAGGFLIGLLAELGVNLLRKNSR